MCYNHGILNVCERGAFMQTLTDARLLIVDDQHDLLALLSKSLREAGYRHIATADSAASARQAFLREHPDFIVLDINLPDGDGFSLLSEFRRHSDVPALFLSARDADSDRLFGLGLGADDYLTKPFLMQELLLRIQLILRRAYRAELARGGMQAFALGECHVNLGDATITRGNAQAALTATEHALLTKLFENRGHIVTYDALCEAVWGEGYYGYENSLGVHIRHLREMLEEDPSHPRFLLTVRGIGYKLVGEVCR